MLYTERDLDRQIITHSKPPIRVALAVALALTTTGCKPPTLTFGSTSYEQGRIDERGQCQPDIPMLGSTRTNISEVRVLGRQILCYYRVERSYEDLPVEKTNQNPAPKPAEPAKK